MVNDCGRPAGRPPLRLPTVLDGLCAQVTLSLSNLYIILPGARACARARAHTICHTLNTFSQKQAPAHVFLSMLSPGLCRGAAAPRCCSVPMGVRDGCTGWVYPGRYSREAYTRVCSLPGWVGRHIHHPAQRGLPASLRRRTLCAERPPCLPKGEKRG